MTKPKNLEAISKITKGIVPTTAIASGFLSPPSWGAPGDLDPTFGDMGRASFQLHGTAFHVQELSVDHSPTATGVVDTTFGGAGIAALPPHQPGASTSCQAMTAQSDGSLLLGGQEGGHGFVNRLLASGALDPSFAGCHGTLPKSPATASYPTVAS